MVEAGDTAHTKRAREVIRRLGRKVGSKVTSIFFGGNDLAAYEADGTLNNRIEAMSNPQKLFMGIAADHPRIMSDQFAGHEAAEVMLGLDMINLEKVISAVRDKVSGKVFDAALEIYKKLYKSNNTEWLRKEFICDGAGRINRVAVAFGQNNAWTATEERFLDAVLSVIHKEMNKASGNVFSTVSPSPRTAKEQTAAIKQVLNEEGYVPLPMLESPEATDADASPGGETQYSLRSVMNTLNLRDEMRNGKRVWLDEDGKVVDKITTDMVQKTGVGALINAAMTSITDDKGNVIKPATITEKEAQKQLSGITRLLNMILKAQDGELVWKFAGAAMFSAVKSNSDGQYGTTIDFSTICRKTQNMVTAMSRAMMKLGRGLTKAEVVELQNDVFKEGGTVNCPVCYVFSRWAGIGGILDNMLKFQQKYGHEYDDAKKLQKRIDELRKATKTKKALREHLTQHDTMYQAILEDQEEQQAERKRLKKLRPGLVKANNTEGVAEIDQRLKEIEGRLAQDKQELKALEDAGAPELAWLERVRSQKDYWSKKKGGCVPKNVLFNLDDATTFAENYPLAWAYRTSCGPAAGKAILPYSDMRLGDLILGAKNNSASGNDLFKAVHDGFSKEQLKAYKKALTRTLAQNLIGGQRFQSTSDFRYDYGLDYLQAFWELQALGGKMQTYTKIVEFAEIVAAVGGDCNISVMPLGRGYENGQLKFSATTGMDIEAASKANAVYDNVQLILVGINDEHIRLALTDDEKSGGNLIGFVIPYHASGASINQFIRGLVQNLGESFNEDYYKDYSTIQTDSVRKTATSKQKARNALRLKLLTGNASTESVSEGGETKKKRVAWTPTEAELASIRGENKDISDMSFDELRDIEIRALAGDKEAIKEYESWSAGVLWNTYQKMWVDKSNTDTYGVRLSAKQAEMIMPHEYWNETVDRSKAYINGFIFRSYCHSLGLTPRFTGINSSGNNIGYGDFSDQQGYWKLLIDRPMYNNDGTARVQQKINVTNLSSDMLTPEYGEKNWHGYRVAEPDDKIANRAADKFVKRHKNDGNQFSTGTSTKLSDKMLQKYTEVADFLSTTNERGPVYNAALAQAQEMVYDAALANDYTVPGLHGTNNFGFTEFKPQPSQKAGKYGKTLRAFFFTNKLRVAKTYSLGEGRKPISSGARRGVYDVALDVKTPLVIDAQGHFWDEIPYNGKTLSADEIVEMASKNRSRYDGVVFNNVVDAALDPDTIQKIRTDPEERQKWESRVVAVFDPNQIKSLDPVTYDDKGKVIPLDERFDKSKNDIRFSTGTALNEDYQLKDGRATYTDARIDKLISDTGYGGSGNYAQAYVSSIDPRDFLRLTLNDDVLEKWNAAEGQDSGIYPLNEEELRGQSQTPYLRIDPETGAVIGHEGRHRMRALWKAGITSAPVVILDETTKNGKTLTPSMQLTAQDFGDGPVNDGATVTLENLIPTNAQYRDQIKDAYGGKGQVQFSTGVATDEEYLAAVDRGDMEEAQKMVDAAAEKDFGALINRHAFDEKTGKETTSLYFYHGSPSQFNVFDRKQSGRNGSAQGQGFYFTSDAIYASKYAINDDGLGTKYRVFLQAKNPIRSGEFNLSPEERRQIFLDMDRRYMDGQGYTYSVAEQIFPVSITSEEQYDELVDRYIRMEQNMDDAAFYAHLSSRMTFPAAVDTMLEHGYDAVIDDLGRSEVVLVFTPEQIKSAEPVTYDDDGNVIPLSERFNSDEQDIRRSTGVATDEDYAAAEKRGDKVTGQKMTDDAAKAAGYTEVFAHGTVRDFTVFDVDRSSYGTYGYGIYLGDEKTASVYGDNLRKFYVRTNNLATQHDHRITTANVLEACDRLGIDIKQVFAKFVRPPIKAILRTNKAMAFALLLRAGNDLDILTDLQDWATWVTYGKFKTVGAKKLSPTQILSVLHEITGYDGIRAPSETVLWDNTMLKLTDPFTYDDEGNLIPLSKRFNPNEQDIRRSTGVATDEDYMKAVKSDDMKEAQQMVDAAAERAMPDSVVRDKDGKLKHMYHGTSNFGFRIFEYGNRKFGLFGDGFYFTDNRDVAEGYTKKGKGETPGVYDVYLNITNPLDMDASDGASADQWAQAFIDADLDTAYLEPQLRDPDFDPMYGPALKTNEDFFRALVDAVEAEGMYDTDARELIEGVLQSMDYDGIVYQGGGRFNKDDPTKHQVYVAFENNQIKSAEPVTYTKDKRVVDLSERFNPEEVDINFSTAPTVSEQDLILKYGEIPQGEGPKVSGNGAIPLKTSDTENVPWTVRNVLEAGITPNNIVPGIHDLIMSGELSRETYTDKAALADAKKWIKYMGWHDALANWQKAAGRGIVSKEIAARGWMLYDNAATASAEAEARGDTDLAEEKAKEAISIMETMVQHERSAAQALQAARILKKMSPTAQLYEIQMSIARLSDQLKRKYGDKIPNLKLDPALLMQFRNAKTQEERDAAYRAIYADIGKQMPASFLDRWNAWRYLAMLGNPRTHMRNIAGNALFMPIVGVKDLTATAIEALVDRLSGGQLERTKAFLTASKADRDLLKAAWGDYQHVEKLALGNNKYVEGDVTTEADEIIRENQRIFNNTKAEWWNKTGGRALEAARKGNSKALDVEDKIFSQPHYAFALAQYCKANHISAATVAKANPEVLAKARDYAVREAQKATYRDLNQLSEFVGQIGKRSRERLYSTKKLDRAFGIAVEGVLPFKKTPANILARAVEYSPAGLARGIWNALFDVKSGKVSAAEAIDRIASGLTGTGLVALGILLSALGKVRGRGSDDEKERDFEKLNGHQAYALEVGDTSFTIDWMAPQAIPFFIGVNLWELTNHGKRPVKLKDLLSAVGYATEPLVQLSCLQGISDIFDSIKYASNDGVDTTMAALATAATNYFTQAIPTLGGQLERIFEDGFVGEGKRYETYRDKESWLTPGIQRLVGKNLAKIPSVDYHQIPYIDAWGREQSTGILPGRAANNLFNPGYVSTVKEDELTAELERLHQRFPTNNAMFPTEAGQAISFEDEDGKTIQKNLNADEYVKYATVRGQLSYATANALRESLVYQAASDEQKIKMIGSAYTYANQYAQSMLGGRISESWVKEAKDAREVGLSPGQYISVWYATKDIKSLLGKNDKGIRNSKSLLVREAIDQIPGITTSQRTWFYKKFDVSETVQKYTEKKAARELEKARKEAEREQAKNK